LESQIFHGAIALVMNSQDSVPVFNHPTHSKHKFYKQLQSTPLPMFHNQASASPTAVPAMKPMVNKESTPKELDTSALLEISVLLKISNSTNSATLKKPPLVLPTKTPPAFLTTKVQMTSVTSVLTTSVDAQMTKVVLVQEPQEQHELDSLTL
jgi:hypothetical protein